MGRRENILRFKYNEIFEDRTRHRLSYNFEHDIEESTTVALKGARIEIEPSVAPRLSYVVTSPFRNSTIEKSIGKLLEVDPGEIVMERSKTVQEDILLLSEDYVQGALTHNFVLPAGVLPKIGETRGATFYHSLNMMNEMITRSQPSFGGLCISKDDPGEINLWFNDTIFCWGINSTSDLPPIEVTTRPAFEADGYRQELIYIGRLGNEVRFFYRENFADLEKPSSTVDVIHDLSDGNIVEILSARIEIVSATATGLQFRVITPFSETLPAPADTSTTASIIQE